MGIGKRAVSEFFGGVRRDEQIAGHRAPGLLCVGIQQGYGGQAMIHAFQDAVGPALLSMKARKCRRPHPALISVTSPGKIRKLPGAVSCSHGANAATVLRVRSQRKAFIFWQKDVFLTSSIFLWTVARASIKDKKLVCMNFLCICIASVLDKYHEILG